MDISLGSFLRKFRKIKNYSILDHVQWGIRAEVAPNISSKEDIFQRINFLVSSCIDFDTNIENDDGRSDGGGTVLWQRSKIKTSAVRSFGHISNQTINLNSFKLDKDYVV
jgi:hypothetical protein